MLIRMLGRGVRPEGGGINLHSQGQVHLWVRPGAYCVRWGERGDAEGVGGEEGGYVRGQFFYFSAILFIVTRDSQPQGG